MRSRSLLLAAALLAGTAAPGVAAARSGSPAASGSQLDLQVPSARAVADLKAGGFMTPNVTWLKHIPLTGPGVSGRVVKVGDQTRFYLSEAKGIHIYDATDPANPTELGFLPIPHLQNEDVEVSTDGTRLVIGADGGLLLPLNANPGVHVIDTSDPRNPKKVGFHADPQHTTSCADAACNWVYGSEGQTYDLRDPANPKRVEPGWRAHLASRGVPLSQGAHDFSRDAAGLVSADTVPRVLLDPTADPVRPKVLAKGLVPGSKQLAYQHNSTRPNALAWQPRADTEVTDPVLRPGELLIANGETNLNPRCNGSSNGPIATWSVANFDRARPMTVKEVFRPVANGNYADGNPAVNALGCSGHYFDYRDGVLAAAWFEHGTRFITVDETNGKMKEIGWFQPVAGSAGAAYWLDDSHVYVADYARGLDIIKIDRSAAPATQQEAEANWLGSLDLPESPVARQERWACRIG